MRRNNLVVGNRLIDEQTDETPWYLPWLLEVDIQEYHFREMSSHTNRSTAIRVYTVCDESRYLIVRNVPSLGCGEELLNLFRTYGPIEDCKPMDAEECETFSDVYWIKFQRVNNARFAKRKLDDFVFLGNQIQVSYAPHFESVLDTKEKLECRRKEVIARIKWGVKDPNHHSDASSQQKLALDHPFTKSTSSSISTSFSHVSSDQNYFASPSMNTTVRVVREKLDKISASAGQSEAEPAFKKTRTDRRRRI